MSAVEEVKTILQALENKGMTVHNLGDEVWDVCEQMQAAIAELEAELEALRARVCGTCRKWTTTECAVAWMDGTDCVHGGGDHDDYCPYWEARP